MRRLVGLLAGAAILGCHPADHDLPPRVRVLAPDPDARVREGDPLELTVRVEDDRADPVRLRVTSDRDGGLHTSDDLGPPVTYTIPLQLASNGPHRVEIVATDIAGNEGLDAVDVRVNGAPSAPVLAVEPADPGPDDDVVGRIVRPSRDPDGSPVGYDWAWSLDGEDRHVGRRPSQGPPLRALLPARSTEPGQTWTLTVEAWEEVAGTRDPDGATTVTRQSVVIGEPSDTGETRAAERPAR